jgi:hypothetical protein
MAGWLDSNSFRVACYLAVAAGSFVAGLREHRRARTNPNLWPTFWFLTAVLFLFMALGRAGNVAELAADIGRREAQHAGWYENRRKYQAMVVSAVAGSWSRSGGCRSDGAATSRWRCCPSPLAASQGSAPSRCTRSTPCCTDGSSPAPKSAPS